LQSVSTTDLLQEIKGWADRMVPDRAAQVFAQRVRSNPVSQSGPAPTTGAPSLELVQREIEAVVHDLAAVRQGLDQLTAKPLPADTNIVTQRVAEPHTRQAFSIPRQRRREQLTPAPETRPITLPGWTLLEVAGDAVALRGPNGVWWAKRGDIVPGVGRVESVVQWGNRWIVATSKGLVSTP